MRWASGHDALRAEWTKLRSLPGTGWLLLGVIALTVAVSAATAATFACPSDGCEVDPAKVSLTGIMLGQAVVAVLAVLAIGGEYSTGMIRVSLAAMPRRTTVLAAKAVILGGLVTGAAVLAVVASLLVGGALLRGNGNPSAALDDGPVLRAAVGSVLYLTLIALLSLGIATVVRDPAIAIGVVLGLLYVLPIIAQVVADPGWRRHLAQIGPMSAGLAVQATRNLDGLPIGPWAGLGVLAAWAGSALLLGGLLLSGRDA